MRTKLKVILLLTSILLIGCSSDEAKNEVDTYNLLVDSTLQNFFQAKIFAEANQDQIMPFIYNNEYTSEIKKIKPLPPILTEEEKELFIRGTIMYNDFYFALGAVSATQNIVIRGKNNKMLVVEAVWSKDSLVSFKREVKSY